MIVLDASVALKWFAPNEPLAAAAGEVLEDIGREPQDFVVPEIFISECFAVLCRMRGATAARVQEAMELIESLGMERIAAGHEMLQLAAQFAVKWKISGYDALYVALASLGGGIWLTADARAARRVRESRLVRVLS